MEKISAVVATFNNERTIRRCLDSLTLNHVDEVIVVDGDSSDNTREIAENYEFVKLIKGIKGIAKAKDLGWRSARFDLILYLDADAYIPEGTVGLLRRYLSTSNVAGVSCKVACANPKKIFARLREFDALQSYNEQFREKTIIECQVDPTICGLFKKKALRDVDGFDLAYPYAEDLKLLYKLRNKGYRVLMVYEAAVYHYHPEDYRLAFRKHYFYGYGRGLLMRERRQEFYRTRVAVGIPFKFLARVLRRAAKGDGLILFPYIFYRPFVEAAYLIGYLRAKANRSEMAQEVNRHPRV